MCWSVAEVLSAHLASLPRPPRVSATTRPGQPSLNHLAVCPHLSLRGQETKWALTYPHINTQMHIHTHTGVRAHTWSQRVTVALVYSALPPSLALLSSSPSSLSCCVSLPTNVSATVGQWLILVCLAKMSSRCLFGLSFPTPFAHPRSSHVLELWVESGMPPSTPHPNAVTAFFGGGGVPHHHQRTKATWTDRDLLFWPEPLFVTPQRHHLHALSV